MELLTKRVVVSVTSDLVTDQRVHRTCITLREAGAKVLLVGRVRKTSLPMSSRAYHFIRFKLWSEKGPLFYAFFNIRLFFFLLFEKADLLVANDLDTLPANYLISRLRGIPLIYDSHEYFTEVPELVGRPKIQRIWKRIERRILPSLSYVITVNDSIANLYRKEFGIEVAVVRNIPMIDPFAEASAHQGATRAEFGIPDDRFVFLLQGAGINVQRGAEEAVEAMKEVEGAVLLVLGSGDVIGELRRLAAGPGLNDKVMFLPKQPLQQLKRITLLADAGLTLDKDTNLNYRFSLPNKLFDYIHAGLPVLASDLPEVRRIVEGYRIGVVVQSHRPEELARAMREMMSDAVRLAQWKENLTFAAAELDWRHERGRLLEVVRNVRQ